MIVGSIGVGLLILILVWILAIIIFVIGVKLQNNISWIVLISAAVFTAILLLFPLETNSNHKRLEAAENLEKDYSFIYRTIFLVILSLSALLSIVFYFVLHCIEPIRPKSIKSF